MNRPRVKVNFAKRAFDPALFVRSSSVCSDRATEIESIRESVDDGFKLAPRSKGSQKRKLARFLTG
jgi:hypothetical protein